MNTQHQLAGLGRVAAPLIAIALISTLAAQPISTPTAITPFALTATGSPPAPWRFVGVPGGKVTPAPLDVVLLSGEPVLRLSTNNSYGALTHPLGGALTTLSWRWKLEQGLALADLRTKAGDDVALKVCVSFDMPLSRLSFAERTQLTFARAISGEALPAATLCYIWDKQLPPGTVLANAYTARVRFWVLDSGLQDTGQWKTHTRNVASDFLRAFGHESPVVPPTTALIVGADSDNTKGSSLAYLSSLDGTIQIARSTGGQAVPPAR